MEMPNKLKSFEQNIIGDDGGRGRDKENCRYYVFEHGSGGCPAKGRECSNFKKLGHFNRIWLSMKSRRSNINDNEVYPGPEPRTRRELDGDFGSS